ncbi:MAG: T6SS effector amidase Tae4 family protein [Leucothrix sp.]
MSFGEFLQWVRRFFAASSSTRSDSPPSRGVDSTVSKPEVPQAPEVPTPTNASSSSEVQTPPVDESAPPEAVPETTAPVEVTPAIAETSAEPTSPETEPSATPPPLPSTTDTPAEVIDNNTPSTPTDPIASPSGETSDPITASPSEPSTDPAAPSSTETTNSIPPTDTTPPLQPETTETETPPPLPEISEPENQPPTIQSIETEDAKVALNQDVTFQIVTNPVEQYADCTLDLAEASNATLVKDIDPATGQFSLRFDKVSSSDNDIQKITVSNPQGHADTAVTVSLMKLFWHNHPGRQNVCDETLFVNQCAIRMGTSLELSGIKLSQDRRVLRRCTTEYRAFKHHKDGLVKGHVLAAQELANWIKSQTSTFGSRSIVHSQEEILGRSGIIFFRDGWGATDHIDIWDGTSLVGGFPSYFDSDFKELWFWDVY